MFPRKRLDIGWRDLAFGLGALAKGARGDRALASGIEASFEPGAHVLVTLSVRSALDLALTALDLPAGSEVLVSALTIPDMARIVEAHGLVAVPVDVDLDTLAPTPEQLEAAAGPRTRVLLVAHLFGTRTRLDALAASARALGLLLIEDCAQAFTGDGYRGHPGADLVLFSFGTIKTATAVGGAVALVRDAELAARMRAEHERWPVQSRRAHGRRLARCALLKLLSLPPLYGGFALACRLAGRDHDRVVQESSRSFAGAELLAAVRRRPSPALVALLARRLRQRHAPRIARRAGVGERFSRLLPGSWRVPGRRTELRTYWVYPVLAPDPDRLVSRLRGAGFDATRSATLTALDPPPGRPAPEVSRDAVRHLVYLPVYPELPERDLERLARLLEDAQRQ